MSEYTNPVRPFLFNTAPVDFSGRGLRNPLQYGMPPALFDPETLTWVNGKPFIGNTPLGDIKAQTGPANPQAIAPVTIKDASKYGDAVILNLIFAAAGFASIGSIVLARPNNYRSALLIQNASVGGLIYYDYDRDATAQSMPLGIGGSRNYSGDTVPQGNLSILSTGAGTVVLEYMNINL